jgi:hypothetical protein
MLEKLYREFLDKTGKHSSYNLAYAWLKKNDDCHVLSEAERRSTAENFSGIGS